MRGSVRIQNSSLEGKVTFLPISDLATNPRNARTHSPRQIQEIARSIERFGFNNPVLIDERNQILAGHGRVEAAKLLGRKRVPTLRIGHLSDQDKRAFVIADNRLAEKAGWDPEILAIELQGLIEDFDVELIGFSIPEVEMILDAASAPANNTADDEIPDVTPNRIVSKPNDLWILGEHRLICGDARRRESFTALLSGEAARLAFVDPPFNVRVRGHVSGKGRIKHREFVQASGEKTSAQFAKFLEDALAVC